TFGFALLEAMSFGLPIVTINTDMTKSVGEIVENGKEGFVIDVKEKLNRYSIHNNERKLINQLVRKTSLLIEDGSLRRKMGRNGIKLIRNGKFSIKQRNKKLKKIYEEALKK
ncbi:MAG: glycosyltransferase, partial [Candidatus Aenigmarchaeota archaeon]|nr:glycosyltransferase [Candidatus Aenigmarchaeota archaeon]